MPRTMIGRGMWPVAPAGFEPANPLQEFSSTARSRSTALRQPDTVAELLVKAGLVMHARVVREPNEDEARRRAFLPARKPAGAAA
ncbi:hypothetical protein [Streptomyces sp. NBC_01235]|uniref:hypothetical protein n=1 Tax=Streptomyces sp. NBC_01235 TaxID=2903788 RepID=UPI002E0FD55E|nr:hypothetical protein OG289_22370 [Streptomyces sp. NBC_01235]